MTPEDEAIVGWSHEESSAAGECMDVYPQRDWLDIVLRLTPEMIRRLILKDSTIGPTALIGRAEGTIKPLSYYPYLIPFGELAERAINMYQRSDASERFEDLCNRFLAFARGDMKAPGQVVIHILRYFAYRGPHPRAALQQLFEALATAIPDPSSNPLVAQILNDVGVLMLLHFNSPNGAIRFFASSVRAGFRWTSAGLENLRLISRNARVNHLIIPGLEETLSMVKTAAHSSKGRGPSMRDRPHPTCDNWSWYLTESSVKPAMLCQAEGQMESRRRAADLFMATLGTLADRHRAILLSVAQETLPDLKPFADAEQRNIELRRQSKQRSDRQFRLCTEAQRVGRLLQKEEFHQADEHLRVMQSLAVTDCQRQLVEKLTEDVTLARANAADHDYDLALPVTAPQARQRSEAPDVRKCIDEIDQLLENQPP